MRVDPSLADKLAPDAASLMAAKKMAQPSKWKLLGGDVSALWGACQGSALYQIKIAIADRVGECTCPSRKRPCKHVLALLQLAGRPDGVPDAERPEWVSDWLAKRQAAAEKKQARQAQKQDKPVDVEAQQKRVADREARISAGLDQLETWMDDVVRQGLASMEHDHDAFEQMARRLVDAQAGGLASRVRRLIYVVGSGDDWPERLLEELGRIALLVHAYRRQSELTEARRMDVRQLVGWNVPQGDVVEQGDRVRDVWCVLGQVESVADERLRTQRTWLLGRATRRTALVLQFAPGEAPFPERFDAGTDVGAELAFFPGVSNQRALVVDRDRDGAPSKTREAWPDAARLDELPLRFAQALAMQPWLDRLGIVVRDVVPAYDERGRGVLLQWDSAAPPLVLEGEGHDLLLAVSGGHPVQVAGELGRGRLRPIGAIAELGRPGDGRATYVSLGDGLDA